MLDFLESSVIEESSIFWDIGPKCLSITLGVLNISDLEEDCFTMKSKYSALVCSSVRVSINSGLKALAVIKLLLSIASNSVMFNNVCSFSE